MAIPFGVVEDASKLALKGGQAVLDLIRGSNKAKIIAGAVAADTIALPALADATGLPIAPRITEHVINSTLNSAGRVVGGGGASAGAGVTLGAADAAAKDFGLGKNAATAIQANPLIIIGGVLVAVLLLRK